MALACEDVNSKLFEVVTVADAEDRVGNGLLQIWELRFGHKAKLLFRFVEQVEFWILNQTSASSRNCSEARIGQHFEF